ncbi:GNAT family N-acetyltransferase [Psychromicrobium sp. YIM B11713]|uniref:GNAT family N-acetyltransferase n=1 Tax=Psychromicrobium sp. YIM B11713 TaxID=3145233 RepID=UPI00374FA241
MTIAIRRYADSDWTEICRIHDAARLDELRPTVGLEAFLKLESTYENEELFAGEVWVAELDGDVVGFIAHNDEEITWTYVDPQHYRQGVASAMLRHVLDRAKGPMELEVLDGNEHARAAYESVGFVWTGTTTGKLAGNESFQATGHTLRWTPPEL